MKEFVVYTLSRIGIFVASYAVIAGVYLAVTGGDSIPLLWPLLLAAVVSAVASYYLLRGQRERFAAVVQRRAERATAAFEERKAREDAE
ncbi:DUF4229 domain-containing protein [Nocardioides iriomotensis]|uniref:DUF4229 domain-containing protein n=1 Tax=Nocardioides iriomotensis TaxID=715784 RepID=A0A4Q5JA85_9ACTN|nr:DUF4229 domain-containing protein [Nocardioides iriomotensis]RYU14889.1 DUF4229 domain-containing protein [Nocardioides iriomotensis]